MNENGAVALERASGHYYRLNQPLEIPAGVIHHARIRIFDSEHPERGYLDFGTKDYEPFRAKYAARPHFMHMSGEGEMVELRDPSYDVRAYFPNGNF